MRERALQPLTGVRGPWVAELPEVAVLRVHAEKGASDDAIYSLVHNRAHTSVAYMFGEQKRLVPADDEHLAVINAGQVQVIFRLLFLPNRRTIAQIDAVN